MQNTDFYLRNVRHLALTISGRNRARGRVIETPLPDPGGDDGHLISHLVLGQVAEEILEPSWRWSTTSHPPHAARLADRRRPRRRVVDSDAPCNQLSQGKRALQGAGRRLPPFPPPDADQLA